MMKNNFVVFLDLDQTIWNHVSFFEQSFDMAKYLKIPHSDEFAKQIIKFWSGDDIANVLVSKESVGRIVEKGIPYLIEHGAKGVDFLASMTATDSVWLNEGAKELLDFLKNNGYTIVAYSDWFFEYQCLLMNKLNVREYFDEIYTWDGTYQKPNKERIQKLATKFPGKKIIYIGDSLHRDIESANYIDCIAIWYAPKYVENNLKIDYYTDNLSSIIEYLKKIG